MASKKPVYKYCIVPQCKNTSFRTPDKIFITLPKGEKIRKKWCIAMKRYPKTNKPLSGVSMRHCCEDHFELENDMENYFRWKMMGGPMRLKPGVVPHIFHCQRPPTVKPIRNAAAKRQHMRTVQEALSNSEPSTSTSVLDMEWVDCGNPGIKVNSIDISESATKSGSNGSCDVDTKHEVKNNDLQISEQSQSSKMCVTTTACSPTELKMSHATTALVKDNVLSPTPNSESSSCKGDFSEFEDDAFTYESSNDEETDDTFKLYNMVEGTTMAIEKTPKLYLGIPKDSYFCLKMLSVKIKVPLPDILITLKKINLNEPYAILGSQFGRSARDIGQIFKRTVPKVSKFIKEFIIWPPKSKIAQCLPIAFRSRYSNVQSIIHCFEIPIQTPSNPLHQSLTWSEYKESNTMKYMISFTPDGLVNFVSCGFGGTASDSVIFKNCGYISNLSPGMDVMVDKGFKNVSNILTEVKCRLVRLPYMSADTISTKEEILEWKRIDSLRVHVERVISRVRNFNMIAPYTCVDLRNLPIYDEVILIVCGLLNMQSSLINC